MLAWYDREKRPLPWRDTDDIAKILVSELMLQQTRVGTVLPYFDRFLARFPTLEMLAAAEDQEVMALWQGLGYYARAKNLQRAAQILVSEGVPPTLCGLRTLPGVGEYTASALAGRLLGIPTASIDGNVERVIARLYGIAGRLDRNPGKAEVRNAADTLISRTRPGDFNQATMELGATICIAGEPRCGLCPIAKWCVARREQLTDVIPRRAPSKKPIRLEHACAILIHQGQTLVRPVAGDGWWKGLYEFPRVVKETGESHQAAAVRAVGCDVSGEWKSLGVVKHMVTHHEIHLHPFVCSLHLPAAVDGTWRPLAELDAIPLPAPQRRASNAAFARVLGEGGAPSPPNTPPPAATAVPSTNPRA